MPWIRMKPPRVGLKQFRADGCLSYLVWESATDPSAPQSAALIDPVMELIETYKEFAIANRLKIAWVIDTHIHADHFSSSHLVAGHFGARIAMSDRTPSQRPEKRLKSGESVSLAALQLTALDSPGHTPDSTCFKIEDLLFTGDTLLIGSTGRTDFPGSDPGAMWDSLQMLLKELSPQTKIMPGHDYNGLLFSTLAVESRKNPHLKLARDAYIQFKREEALAASANQIQDRVDFNIARDPGGLDHLVGPTGGAKLACASATVDASGFASMSIEKYRAKLEGASKPGSGKFLDVRERDEFQEGHMPGTVNLPMTEIALAIDEWKPTDRIYISCLSGRRSSQVAATLTYLGFKDVVNISGGFQAWSNAGFPKEPVKE